MISRRALRRWRAARAPGWGEVRGGGGGSVGAVLSSRRMSTEVTGNVTGLKPSEIKALERIYRRRVPPTQAVSAELAGTLAERSFELHRQVGVLVDRRGTIEHVVVGDASKLVLPDVGRL